MPEPTPAAEHIVKNEPEATGSRKTEVVKQTLQYLFGSTSEANSGIRYAALNRIIENLQERNCNVTELKQSHHKDSFANKTPIDIIAIILDYALDGDDALIEEVAKQEGIFWTNLVALKDVL